MIFTVECRNFEFGLCDPLRASYGIASQGWALEFLTFDEFVGCVGSLLLRGACPIGSGPHDPDWEKVHSLEWLVDVSQVTNGTWIVEDRHGRFASNMNAWECLGFLVAKCFGREMFGGLRDYEEYAARHFRWMSATPVALIGACG